MKHEEIHMLDEKLHSQQEKYEQKLEVYRDRLKRVEMTVYERVETEYSQVLLKKDQMIED